MKETKTLIDQWDEITGRILALITEQSTFIAPKLAAKIRVHLFDCGFDAASPEDKQLWADIEKKLSLVGEAEVLLLLRRAGARIQDLLAAYRSLDAPNIGQALALVLAAEPKNYSRKLPMAWEN